MRQRNAPAEEQTTVLTSMREKGAGCITVVALRACFLQATGLDQRIAHLLAPGWCCSSAQEK
jgi:hypothetical protein